MTHKLDIELLLSFICKSNFSCIKVVKFQILFTIFSIFILGATITSNGYILSVDMPADLQEVTLRKLGPLSFCQTMNEKSKKFENHH